MSIIRSPIGVLAFALFIVAGFVIWMVADGATSHTQRASMSDAEVREVALRFSPEADSMKATDFDWETITVLTSLRVEGYQLALFSGESRSGDPMAKLIIFEPEPEVDGWRPVSAVAGPLEPTGPTLHTLNLPTGDVYAGFISASPDREMEYLDSDGATRTLNVEASAGIVRLPDADPADPKLVQPR